VNITEVERDFLCIHLLGTLDVAYRGQRLTPFPTRKCALLLAYLAVNRQQAHERAHLVGVLWPHLPEARGRHNLRTELWRLRQALGPAAGAIATDATAVRFAPPFPCWIDAEEIARLGQHTPIEQLARAVEHYCGDFLAGFYDDWVLLEQERLRDRYLQGLERLLEHHRARGENAQAIAYALSILAHDPLREEIHRELMRLYWAAGNRSAALAQYRLCSEALAAEMGISPMPETTALYEQINSRLPPWDWESCRAAAQTQVERYLAEMRREKYWAELYTTREAAESEAAAFLAGEANGLVLVSPSGVGKTNLLCHLAEKWLAEGHLVLFYHAGGALTMDAARDVARDLCGAPDAPLPELLTGLGRAAAQRDRAVVLIFDAVNEFHYLDAGPPDLLKRLDGLIGRLESPQVKVIISCRTITWNQMDALGQADLFWERYHLHRPLILEPFTPEELRRAYPAYRRHFQLRTSFDALSEHTRHRCQNPLLLRLTAGVYRGRELPANAPTVAVFHDYYARQVRRDSDRRFLEALVARLAEARANALPLTTLAADPQLRPALGDEPDIPYQRLRDAGVLLEAGQYARQVRFTYERFFEYLLARHYLARRERGELPPGFLAEMARQARDYPPLWGAAIAILLLSRRDDDFIRLAEDNAYEAQQLLTEGLAALHRERPEQALELARRILRLDSTAAWQTALTAAADIGPEAWPVYFDGASAESDLTRRMTIAHLTALWQRDPDTAFHVLAQMIDQVGARAMSRLPYLATTIQTVLLQPATFSLSPTNWQRLSDLSVTFYARRLHLPGRAADVQWLARIAANVVEVTVARAMRDTFDTWGGMRYMLDEAMGPGREFPDELQEIYLDMVNALCQPPSRPFVLPPGAGALLSSNMTAPEMAVSMALSVWVYRQPEEALERIETLFDEQATIGRLWLLLALRPARLQVEPASARRVLAVAERLTERFARQNLALLSGQATRPYIFRAQKLAFMPLAERYHQVRCSDLPLFADLLTHARQTGQAEQYELYLQYLVPVGLYWPEPVLQLLSQQPAPALPSWRRPGRAAQAQASAEVSPALVRTLADLWVVHRDKVERCLLRMGADYALRQRVRLAAEPERPLQILETVYLRSTMVMALAQSSPLGHWIADDFLASFARARSPAQATRQMLRSFLRLMRENDYRLGRLFGLESEG
jgi:DNA-binding SARP family transcriptional activator